jgi:integrase/recombinase XerD
MSEKKFSTKSVVSSSFNESTSNKTNTPKVIAPPKGCKLRTEVGSSHTSGSLSPLRQRMIEDMDLHGYAANTKEVFQRSVMELGKFYNKNPGEITEEEIRKYFLVLKNDETRSSHTMKSHYYGIRFFFQKTLNKNWKIFEIVRPPKNYSLPIVFSHEEVLKILECVKVPIYRMCLTMIYNCGLRLNEALSLKVSDVDGSRQVIRVIGKGGKTREIPLSGKLLEELRVYWRFFHFNGYLFPRPTDESRMINQGTITKAFKYAFQAAGIQNKNKSKATIHSLRHSYATHLMEEGVTIRVIQSLLGHKCIHTTAIYTHMTNKTDQVLRRALETLIN